MLLIKKDVWGRWYSPFCDNYCWSYVSCVKCELLAVDFIL